MDRLIKYSFSFYGHIIVMNCTFCRYHVKYNTYMYKLIIHTSTQHAYNLATYYAVCSLKTYTHENGEKYLFFEHMKMLPKYVF